MPFNRLQEIVHAHVAHPIPFAIGCYIVLSATFARQLFSLLGASTGATVFTTLIAVVLIVLYYRFAGPTAVVLPQVAGSAALIMILCFMILNAKFASEKIHFIEYSLLGYFAARECLSSRLTVTIVASLIFVSLISLNDEFFQAILPYRTFDVRDIIFNLIGGSCGCFLLLLHGRRS